MAVPKRKTSKARRDARRANWKLSIPGIVECPQCHEPKLAHRVCKKCGYYDGKQVVKVTLLWMSRLIECRPHINPARWLIYRLFLTA